MLAFLVEFEASVKSVIRNRKGELYVGLWDKPN